MQNQLTEKMQKLLALAERGIDGEKRNAEKILEKLLKKHNMTIADIDKEQQAFYWISYTNRFERKLISQIIYAVLGKDRDTFINKYKPHKVGVNVTPMEKIELAMLCDLYRRALREELALCYDSFVQVNNIYPENIESRIPASLTDKERIKKILDRAMIMDRVQIRKRIEKH